MSKHLSYDTLSATFGRLHHLEHFKALAAWDQAANMPPKGNQARAEAMAELATLMHGMRTDPLMPTHLMRAEQEDLSAEQRANLREMQRQWRGANALPAALVERKQLATARCEHAGAASARPTTGPALWKTCVRCWPRPARKRSGWPTTVA